MVNEDVLLQELNYGFHVCVCVQVHSFGVTGNEKHVLFWSLYYAIFV